MTDSETWQLTITTEAGVVRIPVRENATVHDIAAAVEGVVRIADVKKWNLELVY